MVIEYNWSCASTGGGGGRVGGEFLYYTITVTRYVIVTI